MANGRHPTMRYRIIHACLSSKVKTYWTIKELIEKLAAHDLIAEKRSIERDFEAMRFDERLAYMAPIKYSKLHKGYYYTDPHFTIDTAPLTEEDLAALSLAANILHQYKGAKVVQQFEGMMDRLGKAVNHLRQPQNNKLIAFEHTPYYKGNDYFDVILRAITDKQPLRITYRKFADHEDHLHVLHPYFLKEYRGRWYVLGHSDTRGRVILLALDRMNKAEAAPVTFIENKTLKPKEYFQHTLGVTLGKGPVEEIELWFSPTMAPYIKTQHLHHTQKTVSEEETGLVITLKLIPNPELTQLILSYGADVKVQKPQSLMNKIKEESRKVSGLY